MYKVLIIEDEALLRKGVKYIMNWIDYNCIVVGEAANGKEGLELIEELSPDIIILDINMPVLNGIDMLKAIPDKNFESIIVSGYDEFSYAKEAIANDVVDYLLKPLDYEELGKAVSKAIARIKDKRLEIDNVLDNKGETILLTQDLDPKIFSKTTSQVIAYIEENYMNKVTIEDLVDYTQRSRTTINNKFKDETGKTITDYLNIYRINKAIDMMKNSDQSIENISYNVGFSSHRYFTQVFKKYLNTKPSDFMKEHLG